jgi:hypothetical protein
MARSQWDVIEPPGSSLVAIDLNPSPPVASLAHQAGKQLGKLAEHGRCDRAFGGWGAIVVREVRLSSWNTYQTLPF